MLFYYITDRRQFPGSPQEQRAALLVKISDAARAGVDYIQLREKDISARELLRLAEDAMAAIQNAEPESAGNRKRRTRLLINSRLDVAIAAGVDGVHLRSDDISAAEARAAYMNSPPSRTPETGKFLIACSCHAAAEVRSAESDGADVVVFAPVFQKDGVRGVGLQALRAACSGMPAPDTPEPSRAVNIPVLALGGVTVENARSCVEAGAAGIAGIRLFQDNDVAEVVERLRDV